MNKTLANHPNRRMAAIILCTGIGSAALAAPTTAKAGDEELQELSINLISAAMGQYLGFDIAEIIGIFGGSSNVADLPEASFNRIEGIVSNALGQYQANTALTELEAALINTESYITDCSTSSDRTGCQADLRDPLRVDAISATTDLKSAGLYTVPSSGVAQNLLLSIQRALWESELEENLEPGSNNATQLAQEWQNTFFYAQGAVDAYDSFYDSLKDDLFSIPDSAGVFTMNVPGIYNGSQWWFALKCYADIDSNYNCFYYNTSPYVFISSGTNLAGKYPNTMTLMEMVESELWAYKMDLRESILGADYNKILDGFHFHRTGRWKEGTSPTVQFCDQYRGHIVRLKSELGYHIAAEYNGTMMYNFMVECNDFDADGDGVIDDAKVVFFSYDGNNHPAAGVMSVWNNDRNPGHDNVIGLSGTSELMANWTYPEGQPVEFTAWPQTAEDYAPGSCHVDETCTEYWVFRTENFGMGLTTDADNKYLTVRSKTQYGYEVPSTAYLERDIINRNRFTVTLVN